ncbi:MAG: Txe/YoeB family addiction module toxin [Prolixibacteraceae bacterium]|jgi:toxin YoeB
MGKYKIAISDHANKHLADWKKSGQIAVIKRIERIFKELSETPYSGIGSPEQLKFNFPNCWSRRIDKKNRIIYQVHENIVTVFVVSAKGHYNDK